MTLVVAIIVAFLLLPLKWGATLIVCAAAVETSQAAFWFWWTHRATPTVGREAMTGERAEVVEALRPEGWVRVQGELWRARSERGAERGETVLVRRVDGLTLLVE